MSELAIQNESSELPNESHLRVLIADDDLTNRMVLKSILDHQNCYTYQAENGQQAVEIFQRERPDLVLMDVMMPVMNGYEATTRIKQLCGDQFVPVIFLTAMTDEKGLVQCIESGGDDFLTKPYNHLILKARIDALVRIKDLYSTIHTQKSKIELHTNMMEQEAKVAETLFSNIVQSSSLEKDYIKYLLSPMSLFSGDMLIAADKPSGGINIMLGDFTGHGLAAATGAMPAATIFYQMTEKGYSIVEIAKEINAETGKILPTGMFLAACFLEINPSTKTVSVWSGGIPEILVYSGTDKCIKTKLASQNLPLGIIDNSSFNDKVEILQVEQGDRFYIYTDGVTETENPAEDMFGQERLESIFQTQVASADLFDTIVQSLSDFRDGYEQSDDITLAEIRIDFEQLHISNESLVKESTVASNPASSWKVVMEFNADMLRNGDPLPVLVQSIAELQGLAARRQQLYTIITEMFSNALEHGLLGLDSKLKSSPEGFLEYYELRKSRLANLEEGGLTISIEHSPTHSGGRLSIRVEDTGPGFDFNKEFPSLDENLNHCGRGVPLLKQMCESVTHHGVGNIVEVVYLW